MTAEPRWHKRGLVYAPTPQWWRRSHASTPCAVVRDDGLVRVYVTTRDERNRSHVGSVDLDPAAGFRVVAESAGPLLAPGDLGLFDDSGVAVGCVVVRDGVEHLFHLGWNLRVTVPWMNTIGLARRPAGSDEPFEKVGRVPVLDRSEEDPFSLSYPWVLAGSDGWRMWYGTNVAWGAGADDMRHEIAHATSADGRRWRRHGEPVVRLDGPEIALSRPCVRATADGYEMWFCRRGTGTSTYRIEHATSPDGLVWTRDHREALPVSADGFDHDMTCYPCVFDHDGRTFMLYNGDGYGRDGVGLAELER